MATVTKVLGMNRIKDRLIGVVVTLITSCIMFLTYSYFGSFETKAGSESKYAILDKKITIVLCILDKRYCEGEVLKWV